MKRIISILLVLVICLTLSMPAFAEENDNATEPPSDQFVREYAESFMISSQDNKNSLSIENFYHLTDGKGKLTGYYITFENNGEAAGYTLLSLITGESPIVEFAFEGFGPLAYENASYALNSDSFLPASETTQDYREIIFSGPGQLYVPVEGDKYYSAYDHEITTIETNDTLARSSVDIYGGIVDWSTANIKASSVFKISNFGSGTDYWLMSKLGKGNVCSPTAATNVLWYWGKMRNRSSIMNRVASKSTNYQKAQAIFDILSPLMGTTGSGGTKIVNVIGGYTGFFGEQPGVGAAWSYKELENGTSYSTYKKELQNNCPIHLSLHTKNTWYDYGDGHDVMTLGYAESNTGSPYLFVMNGWNENGYFVNFNYYPNFYGYKIWVS